MLYICSNVVIIYILYVATHTAINNVVGSTYILYKFMHV